MVACINLEHFKHIIIDWTREYEYEYGAGERARARLNNRQETRSHLVKHAISSHIRRILNIEKEADNDSQKGP